MKKEPKHMLFEMVNYLLSHFDYCDKNTAVKNLGNNFKGTSSPLMIKAYELAYEE